MLISYGNDYDFGASFILLVIDIIIRLLAACIVKTPVVLTISFSPNKKGRMAIRPYAECLSRWQEPFPASLKSRERVPDAAGRAWQLEKKESIVDISCRNPCGFDL